MATAGTKIPVLDLAPQIDGLWRELEEAITGVVRSGRFILGPQVAALEDEAARYLGARHAVAVGSGTDAVIIALRALEIGPGDEVITTPFTFFATAEAIGNVGATPVFADIDPHTYNIDPEQIEAAISPRTKAILPVHLFGQAAEMEAISSIAARHGLRVIEDTAQAFGGLYRKRMLGTIGAAGAFSFFPSKNLGAFGDGGMLATNDDHIADVARRLRTHGARRKYENEMLGYNSRLDEIQAAVLRVKLPHVDAWNAARRRAARLYDEQLADLSWLATPAASDDAHHVYHQYTARIIGRDRDDIKRRLDEAGIGTMIYYPHAVHRLPVFRGMNCTLPQAERAAREVLSLPMGPSIADETIQYICDILRGF